MARSLSLKNLGRLPTTLRREDASPSRKEITMTVAALSTAGFSQYIAASSLVSASQQAFQSMQQSLASGNLTAAQSAFKTYQQLNQGATTANSSSVSSSSGSSQLSTDMAALGSAISSGSLTTAQSAFATVQSDLKTTPSQAVTNAEGAVAQTVQWVDDLLSLSSSSSESSTLVDPTTSILDSAYGLSPSAASIDPTTGILNSAYDSSTSGAGAPATAPVSSLENPASAVSNGNDGSAASVNIYA
jgi:hypothetical protein